MILISRVAFFTGITAALLGLGCSDTKTKQGEKTKPDTVIEKSSLQRTNYRIKNSDTAMKELEQILGKDFISTIYDDVLIPVPHFFEVNTRYGERTFEATYIPPFERQRGSSNSGVLDIKVEGTPEHATLIFRLPFSKSDGVETIKMITYESDIQPGLFNFLLKDNKEKR